MAFSAADNSPPCSRSHFQKLVSLQDWWLTKPQTDDDRKTIGVSGLPCTSQLNRAERCFSSAPIDKVYDFFELETVDGVCVILQGYINKEKTLENGFSSEVFDHFVIGFPSYWEEFCTSCPERGSSDECILREHEEGKDSIGKFHDMNTGVEDCKDDGVTFFDPKNVNIAGRMKGRRKKKGGKKGAAARQGIASITGCKRKLTFESTRCKMAKRQKITRTKSTSTRTASKGPRKRYVSANVLSPESFSGKRSRSGRVLLPCLEFWRNQTVVYDAGRDKHVTGVRDAAQSSKVDTSKNSKAIKKRGRKAGPIDTSKNSKAIKKRGRKAWP